MRNTRILIATIALLAAAPAVHALPCAGFTDVDSTSPFCPNVEWVKNRAITTGCTSATQYCPADPVSRLAMAAFLNRFGTAMTPVKLGVDATTGAVDLDLPNNVVCQTANYAVAGFPRRAYVDLSFTATATADVDFAADLVQSTDNGTNWTALNSQSTRGSVSANHWGRARESRAGRCRRRADGEVRGSSVARRSGRRGGPDRQPLQAAGADVQPRRIGVAVLSPATIRGAGGGLVPPPAVVSRSGARRTLTAIGWQPRRRESRLHSASEARCGQVGTCSNTTAGNGNSVSAVMPAPLHAASMNRSPGERMNRIVCRSANVNDLASASTPRPPARCAPATAVVRSGGSVVALRALALLSSLAFAATVAASDRIFLNAEAIDTASDYAQTQRASAVLGSFTGKRLHLVQFTGPVRQQWVDSLAADGLRVVNYIPDNAYLVWGDAAAIAQLQARARTAASSVQWDGVWKTEYKVHPAVWASEKDLSRPLASRTVGTDRFSLQLVADAAENASTLKELAALGGTVFADPGALPGFVNLDVTLPAAALAAFANRADIVSIHRYIEPQQNDERQSLILAGNLTGNAPTPGNYFDRLTAWGFSQSQFDTSGIVVDVTDDGADVNPSGGIPTNAVAGPVAANHFVFFQGGNRPIGAAIPSGTSRFVYKGRFGTAGADGGLGYGGHGQLNMSIVGGYVPTGSLGGVDFGVFPHSDASAFRFGLGVAPFVRLANSVVFDPGFTNPSLPTMLSAGYAANARISTNSWGDAVAGAYNTSSQTYDGLVRDAQSGTAGTQQMVIVFSAGNAGSGASTVGSPGTAKNVITVGAAENVQAFGGPDGCGITDAGADSANDIISFSSRGPTTDGRLKPDLVGPGTHVSGIAFVTPTSTGNATVQAGYRGDGVCGGVPPSIPFPAGQNWYTASSGTSHSTPAAAGGAALIFQQFLNNPSYLAANRVPASGPPSPALVKAYMMNSTRYMNGVGANDTLWSTAQGMGMMNLGTAFDGVSRATRDQVPVERFNGVRAAVALYSGTISDPSKPFRVTLAWTDAPGATSGNAYVNNLDLQVIVGGSTVPRQRLFRVELHHRRRRRPAQQRRKRVPAGGRQRRFHHHRCGDQHRGAGGSDGRRQQPGLRARRLQQRTAGAGRRTGTRGRLEHRDHRQWHHRAERMQRADVDHQQRRPRRGDGRELRALDDHPRRGDHAAELGVSGPGGGRQRRQSLGVPDQHRPRGRVRVHDQPCAHGHLHRRRLAGDAELHAAGRAAGGDQLRVHVVVGNHSGRRHADSGHAGRRRASPRSPRRSPSRCTARR